MPTPIVAGVMLNCPCGCPPPPCDEVVAEPVRETVRLTSDAFDAMVTLPVKLPEDCGVKVTVKGALAPGARVSGRSMPLAVKPAPVTVACVMVRVVDPLLVSVSD